MTRDIRSSPPAQLPRSAGRGDYHLLVIGIDDYTHFDPLKTAVNDAKTIRDVLTAHYGFAKSRVTELWNKAATAENIDRAFRAYGENGEKALGEVDSLLIYFAGHGSVDSFSEMGAWAPVDARKDTLHGSILNETIKAYLARLAARHVLVISDSCFSGDFFKHREAPQSIGKNDAYMQQALAKNSRQALTSGGLEPVSDDGFGGHSVFAYYLLKALRENTAPYLFPADLHDRVKGGVSQNAKQTPRLGHLFGTRGEEGGEFVLFREGEFTPATPPPIKPRPIPAKPVGTIWIAEGKGKHGPYEKDEIAAMIARTSIRVNTLIWQDGMEDWQEIGKRPEWRTQFSKFDVLHKRKRVFVPLTKKEEQRRRDALRAAKQMEAERQLREDYLEKAKNGDAQANFELGCLHLKGLSGRKSQSKAANYFLVAAKKGHAEAYLRLGILFEKRDPCTIKNLIKAFQYFTLATKLNSTEAKLAAGRLYLSSNIKLSDLGKELQDHLNPNSEYGLELIKAAAAEGSASAETELGLQYLSGRFIHRSQKQAEKHFQTAAKLGDSLAGHILHDPAEMKKAKADWHAQIDRLQNAIEET